MTREARRGERRLSLRSLHRHQVLLEPRHYFTGSESWMHWDWQSPLNWAPSHPSVICVCGFCVHLWVALFIGSCAHHAFLALTEQLWVHIERHALKNCLTIDFHEVMPHTFISECSRNGFALAFIPWHKNDWTNLCTLRQFNWMAWKCKTLGTKQCCNNAVIAQSLHHWERGHFINVKPNWSPELLPCGIFISLQSSLKFANAIQNGWMRLDPKCHFCGCKHDDFCLCIGAMHATQLTLQKLQHKHFLWAHLNFTIGMWQLLESEIKLFNEEQKLWKMFMNFPHLIALVQMTQNFVCVDG